MLTEHTRLTVLRSGKRTPYKGCIRMSVERRVLVTDRSSNMINAITRVCCTSSPRIRVENGRTEPVISFNRVWKRASDRPSVLHRYPYGFLSSICFVTPQLSTRSRVAKFDGRLYNSVWYQAQNVLPASFSYCTQCRVCSDLHFNRVTAVV